MGDDLFIQAVNTELPQDVRVEYLGISTEWSMIYQPKGAWPIEIARIPNAATLVWRYPLKVFASIARRELRKTSIL